MNSYKIKECSINEMEKILDISIKTFYQTFSDGNTKEDMDSYIKENLSFERIKDEISNKESKFYIVEESGEVLAYMKVNFDNAQTESKYNNTLEVQRIYILEEYKGKKIGKSLIEKAKEIGRKNSLRYIWLGVWEKNYNAIKFYEKQGFEKFDTHIFKLGNDEQIDNIMRFKI